MNKNQKINEILYEINDYITKKNLLFKKTYIKQEDLYHFELIDSKKSVGNTEISVAQDSIIQPKGRRLRSGIEIEDKVIHVNWINIEKGYLGKKYGTIILIYALCLILLDHPNIEYAKLDDESDRSDNIRNIYSSILFAHDEHTELTGKFKTLLQGPEKTAYIGYYAYFDILLKKVLDIKKKNLKSGKKKHKNLQLSLKKKK
tara:strand:- start:423 stop:1028 length:606 start_codon:yes stop_codon:yes gene_type:complete